MQHEKIIKNNILMDRAQIFSTIFVCVYLGQTWHTRKYGITWREGLL